jgi:hypothetical protein
MKSPLGARPSSLLGGTLKVALVVGLAAVAAADWLSRASLDRAVPRDFAGRDPVITGSVAEAAERTRLDPCAAPPPGRAP